MAFTDDVADLIAAEVSHIGLGTDATTEVSGGGYAHKVPTYAAASGGAAQLTAPLEFDGPAMTEVTHLLYKRGGSLWQAVAVTPRTINSDGRIDLASAPVTATLGS
jgi:hypothetical protein